jgi:hypothetical protein
MSFVLQNVQLTFRFRYRIIDGMSLPRTCPNFKIIYGKPLFVFELTIFMQRHYLSHLKKKQILQQNGA